jgi:hypothetical protein
MESINKGDVVQKWEYAGDLYYVYQNDVSGYLNGYGADGWELVSAHFNASNSDYRDEHYRFIFKRLKP